MKALVLINGAAGSVAGARSDDGPTRFKDLFARYGVEATTRMVHGAELSKSLLSFQKDADSTYSALVVAGGDGTINAAASALAGSDRPLGIIPMGTLNHFAKDLGLPLDMEGAVKTIAAGKTRLVDVAELNGRVFVNNSSVGLYPFMVARRNEHQRRHGLGKFLAMVPAAIQTLLGTSWHRIRIEASGERQLVRTPCVFVGNNVYEVGLPALGSRARLDRGELDVHVVKQQTRLGLLLLPFKIALMRTDPERDVQTFRGGTVTMTSNARRLRVSLDGEIETIETPLRYRSRPGALRVFADLQE
jgi:diacylglycerol kinase family enzyme